MTGCYLQLASAWGRVMRSTQWTTGEAQMMEHPPSPPPHPRLPITARKHDVDARPVQIRYRDRPSTTTKPGEGSAQLLRWPGVAD